MTDSARNVLERLERDLENELAQLRKQLAPLERELSNVRRALKALDAPEPPKEAEYVEFRDVKPAYTPYRGLTMKQLTVKALSEHFQNGATSNELLEFFANAWGRKDIVRESLSPQLSRLKREGKIGLKGKVWHLLAPKEEAPDSDEPGASENQGGGGGSPSSSGDEGGQISFATYPVASPADPRP